jgi:low affinity Fe/Cu permease
MRNRALEHNGGHRPLERSLFAGFARSMERQLGRPVTFALALLTVILWALSGPLFGWSDTWQLVINTGTTIVTFLMVFIIQNTQMRDTRAVQLKLDELIRVSKTARNSLISLEDKSESEVEEVEAIEHGSMDDRPAEAVASPRRPMPAAFERQNLR